MGGNEDRVTEWARLWRILHPLMSWTLGAGLFVYVTFSSAGRRDPEWYAIVGGLMTLPIVTTLGSKRRGSRDGNGNGTP